MRSTIGLLEDIGLIKSEIKVYLALLELGSSTTGPIVEKSGASSSKIYEILEKLMQKGLASFVIKSGTKYFEAAEPKRLVDYLKEKKSKLKLQEEELKQLIPELELKKNLSKHKSEATIYKGMKGLETAFYEALDTLKPKDEFLVIGVPSRSDKVNRFFVKWNKERGKRRIQSRQLFDESAKGELQTLPENNPASDIRFHPTGVTTPAAVNVLKDRVIIFPSETGKDPLLISINNKEVAESFRAQFEQLWDQDVKIYRGFESVTNRFASMRDELKKGEEYYTLGATYGKRGERLKKWFVEYHKIRVKRGVIAKLLTVSNDHDEVKKTLSPPSDPGMKFAEIKRLPPNFSSPMQITMYKGNKALMLLFSKDMVCFEIESKQLHDNFKNYFDSLWNQETRVVKGLDAIQDIFEDMLQYNHVDLIGARGYFMDYRPEYINAWEKRAIKKGFTMRNIVDVETKGHRVTILPFMKTQYTIPKEFSASSVFWIYGNKVVISNWVEKEPTAVIIENKNLHDVYKKQFEQLWNQETVRYEGIEGMKIAYFDALDATPEGSVTFVYGASITSKETDEILFEYNKERAKKNVKLKIIFNLDAKSSATTRSAKKEFNPLAEIKFIPYSATPTNFEIFPDRVIMSTATKKDPTTIVIKNKEVV
ncbi:TrmB family transcriptional regulator, partial [Candidatus Woesearchaeota archaeon]|nr:TrmB family transcriptional regulator [Candidatus Woesearchaeota archaeon]